MADLAVKDVVISIPAHVELDVSGIGRGNLRLRHEKGRSDLATHEGIKPLSLLLLRTVLGKDFHVARVWRSTVYCLTTL